MNTFTFGKYKGRSIMSVLSENPAMWNGVLTILNGSLLDVKNKKD